MSAKAPMFKKVAIIGVGLIGSSLALAMRRHGLAKAIVGCTRSASSRDKILELGLTDTATQDPAEAATDADLIVICAPVGAYEDIGRAIEAKLRPGAIVTDAGSVKQAVMRDLSPFIPDGVHFVPGHPIAGTEHSGPESGFAELFQNRWCILTPAPGTDAGAIEKISALWQACGAMITTMDARHHDHVLAITSHLPQLISYTIVSTAGNLEDSLQGEVAKYSAGGFRDFTRLAASDPVMWRDIYLNNREAVLEMLQRFSEDLTALQRAIRWGEGAVLEEKFRSTREARRKVIAEHQAGTFDPREPGSE